MTVCETQAVALAEEAYRTQHGAYFVGSCGDLPGYTPTDPGNPGEVLTCQLAATPTDFSVSMRNSWWWQTCIYDSRISPPLDCS